MQRKHFIILISLVAISGFSQGMLLPLISIIFEQNGLSSTWNGFHATSLYIGVLIASPFMEKPLRRYGYKPVILFGGLLVSLSLSFFPLWKAIWFWFILRMIIGIGDHMLHFGIQTWITSRSSIDNRGRLIAYYGLSFGIGFTAGPLMATLLKINEVLPFLLSAILSFAVWSTLFLLRNEYPDIEEFSFNQSSSFKRFYQAFRIGWIAFLPPLTYGFLEASLHGNFPVYALRIGYDIDLLAILLPTFTIGGLITQLPLGILSDKIGRQNVLYFILLGGFGTFLLAGYLEENLIGLIIALAISGMLLGSTFSLGISYMTDLLPNSLLPAGNILCGISYSIGSIIGPFLGGVYIQLFEGVSYFFLLSSILFCVLLPLTFSRKKQLTVKKQS